MINSSKATQATVLLGLINCTCKSILKELVGKIKVITNNYFLFKYLTKE